MRSRLIAGTSVVALVALAGIALSRPLPWRVIPPSRHVTTALPSVRARTDSVVFAAAQHPSGQTSILAHLSSADCSLTASQVAQIARLGGTIYRRLPLIGDVAIRLPAHNLTELAALPFITHLSSDTSVRKADEFVTQASKADAAYAKYNLTGAGVGVAVVDSGIELTPDLSFYNGIGTRIVATRDFINPLNILPNDDCGHGTHVAGIIGGNGYKSTGDDYTRTFYGVARKANLINVRVLDAQGNGAVSDVIAGLDWVVRNRALFNIRIVNLSLGHPVAEPSTTDPLCQAVEKVWKAGIVVVCAAGNNGRASTTQTGGDPNEGYGTSYGSIQSPANDPYVITVGATKPFNAAANQYDPTQRAYDRIATYSSRGPSVGELTLKPDIVAPGNRVISLRPKDDLLVQTFPNNQVYKSWYVDYATTDRSKYYYVLSGTSMASPVVAGAAALLLEKDPSLTPDTIKARLMLSADKWTNPDGSTDPFTYGAGYLNVTSALSSTATASGYAISPTLTVQTDGTLTIATGGAAWSNGSLWGTGYSDLRAIWGTAFSSPLGLADPGYLWSAANQVQNTSWTWGGPGTTPSAVQGDSFTWGGPGSTTTTSNTTNIPINGE